MFDKPECYSPERTSRNPEVFHGIPSFMGLPVVKKAEEINKYDVVVMGAPWEGVCTYGGFTGVEMATKTIRKVSTRYGAYLPEYDMDAFDFLTGADYGDIAVKNGDTEFTYNSAMSYMKDVNSTNAIPITFGGDHSLSYPLITEFAKKYDGNIGIIHFDAHMDNMDSFGEEKFARCTPFKRLYDLDGFNPKNLVHLGIRGPRNNPAGIKAAREVGATVMTIADVKRKGVEAAIKEAIEIASQGTKAIYITVCSDILDVAFNPGGPADLCGVSSYELSVMLYECGLAGAKGYDYMEIYPPSDHSEISSHAACWMTIYFLAGLAKHKQLNTK